MKKVVFLFVAMLLCIPVSAEKSAVKKVRERMPEIIPTKGTLVEVATPDEPLVAVLDLYDECTPEMMEQFQQYAEDYEAAFMAQFDVTMGETLLTLARAAYNAGIPFALKIVASCDKEGAMFVFSPEDLEKCLK